MACCGRRDRVQSTRENPTLLGTPTEDGAVIRARVTVTMSGYRPGETGYFTGSRVEALIAGQQLVPV